MPQHEKPAWRAAAILVLCAPIGACGDQQLDRDAMARQLRNMASLSAEGAFVSSELRARHLKPSFVSVHIDNLAEDANTARQEIAKPAAPAVERQLAAAQALADQLTQGLRAIQRAQFGAEDQLQLGEQTLKHLKTEFEALEKTL
jgi:hypothetical protein